MAESQDNTTRLIILQAAQTVFSERAFDGARMEEIARTAGVNKSLIYYYFKSKKEIWQTLVKNFYTETEALIRHQYSDISLIDEEVMSKRFYTTFTWLESRADMIRLIFLESAKKKSEVGEGLLFEFMDSYVELNQNITSFKDDLDMAQIRVEEFFTMMGPVILYILFHEKWEKHYQVGCDLLRDQFIQAVSKSHLSHHKERS